MMIELTKRRRRPRSLLVFGGVLLNICKPSVSFIPKHWCDRRHHNAPIPVMTKRMTTIIGTSREGFIDEGYLGAGGASSSGSTQAFFSSRVVQEGKKEVVDDAKEDDECNAPQEKFIMLISDATGVMGKSALQKCLNQFDFCDNQVYTVGGGQFKSADGQACTIKTQLYTNVRTEKRMAELIKHAQETNAMIIFTLANPEMRDKTMKMCELSKVLHVDLMGSIFDTMSSFFGQTPRGTIGQSPGRRTMLSDNYFRRIEAVEFTLKADDGQSPWLLEDADVILVGVSRTGKTPLSVLLSQTLNLRVANVPLVLEVPPPKELLSEAVDPKRVICLTISPGALGKIRSSRLRTTNVKAVEEKAAAEGQRSNYADKKHMVQELMNARRLADRQGWTEVDVTGKAIEETGGRIAEMLKGRFPDLDFI